MKKSQHIQFHENSLHTALNLVDLPKCEADIDFNARIILAGISGMIYASGNHDISEAISKKIGLTAYEPKPCEVPA